MFKQKSTLPALSRVAFTVLLSLGLASHAISAEVPEGTELAADQHLRWNNGADPQSFDPAKVEGVPEANVVRNIFETLVISNEAGDILPGTAEKWEHSEDYKTWTFYIRPTAKWSNGDAVTAHDFEYAFKRLADPNTASPYASYLNFLKLENAEAVISGKKDKETLGVKALDDHRLQLNLSESVPYVHKLVEHYVLAPVPQKVIEKHGDAWVDMQNIVTNGAFLPIEWTINEKIVLEPNKHYYDNAKTVLQKVTLYPIVSGKTGIDRYRADDLDITNNIPSELFAKLKKEYPTEVHTPQILCTYYYEFNTQKAPFDNPNVRRAISMALDRDIIANKVLGQGQAPAYNFTPPAISGAEKMEKAYWTATPVKERSAEAVKLLEEAGFNKANPLEFSVLYNTSESHKKIAIAASSILGKNLKGAVKVKMENQEWKSFLDSRHQGKYDVARAGWCADYNEATTFLNYFLSTTSVNTSFYKSAEFDAAIAEAFKAKDDAGRAEAYAKAEKILTKDAPYIPFYHYVAAFMIKPYVKGFAAKQPGQSYYFKDIYLTKH